MRARHGFCLIEVCVAALIAVAITGAVVQLALAARAHSARGQGVLTDAERMASIAARLRSDLASLEAPDGDPAAAIAAVPDGARLHVRRGATAADVTWLHDAATRTLVRAEGAERHDFGQGSVSAFSVTSEPGDRLHVRVELELAATARRLTIISTPVEISRLPAARLGK